MVCCVAQPPLRKSPSLRSSTYRALGTLKFTFFSLVHMTTRDRIILERGECRSGTRGFLRIRAGRYATSASRRGNSFRGNNVSKAHFLLSHFCYNHRARIHVPFALRATYLSILSILHSYPLIGRKRDYGRDTCFARHTLCG